MSLIDTMSAIVGGIVERMGFQYLALREYKVSSQNADGTLELDALDPKYPGLSNVKIMQIGPGSSIKIPSNTTVLVGFKNGDQTKRYAMSLWDGAQSQQMIIECLDLQLGGQATDFVIKGTTYRTAETTMNTAIASAVTTLNAIPVAADLATAVILVNGCAVCLKAIGVAILAFEAKTGTFLSSLVKVK